MRPSNDKEAVTLILEGLVKAGCSVVSVQQDYHDIEDQTAFTDISEAVELCMEVDTCVVYVNTPEYVLDPEDPRPECFIWFVFGNDPEEVACDYSTSLSEYLDPIIDPWL